MFNVVTFPSLRVTLINFPSLRGGQVGHRGDRRPFDEGPLGGVLGALWALFSHFVALGHVLGASWALLGRFYAFVNDVYRFFIDFGRFGEGLGRGLGGFGGHKT